MSVRRTSGTALDRERLHDLKGMPARTDADWREAKTIVDWSKQAYALGQAESPVPADAGVREAETVLDPGHAPIAETRIQPADSDVGGVSSAIVGAVSGAISRLLGKPVELCLRCAGETEANTAFANFEVLRRWIASGGDPQKANVVVRLILQTNGFTFEDVPRKVDWPHGLEPRLEGALVVLPPMSRKKRRLWRRWLVACGEGEVFERVAAGAPGSETTRLHRFGWIAAAAVALAAVLAAVATVL